MGWINVVICFESSFDCQFEGQCSLQWRQNGRYGVSNHQRLDCLQTIKDPRHWPSWGESTGDRWFPSQRASNAEMFPFERYHDTVIYCNTSFLPCSIYTFATHNLFFTCKPRRWMRQWFSKKPRQNTCCHVSVTTSVYCLFKSLFQLTKKESSKINVSGLVLRSYRCPRTVAIWLRHQNFFSQVINFRVIFRHSYIIDTNMMFSTQSG